MEEMNKKGILGQPKYWYGDEVTFQLNKQVKQPNNSIKIEKQTFTGKVWIVDKWGTFFQKDEPSYDIMVGDPDKDKDACLYKHINESLIINYKK